MLLAAMLFTGPLTAENGSPGLLAIAAAKGVKGLGQPIQQAFLFSFVRDGQRRDTLLLLAGAAFETDEVQPPGSSRCVSLLAAMPFNLGDGAILKISVRDGGTLHQILERPLDPAHIRADRAWVPIRFDIPAGLQRPRLLFEVSAGARGDGTGDWVGLAPGTERGCLFAM